MAEPGSSPVPPAWCEHGGGHDGGVPSAATAPANARAWLLIEFGGRWSDEATTTALPRPLAKLAIAAAELGIRVQLIRRPALASRPGGGQGGGEPEGNGAPAVFIAWTGAPAPWIRRTSGDELGPGALEALAAGVPAAGAPEAGPLFLVCTHGRRDRCCALFGVPLARDLAARHADGVWETTHVGGHRFAANLVILPHGLYYGPVDTHAALAAIDAYKRGEITARGYRGRAGQPAEFQEAECAAAASSGTLRLLPEPGEPAVLARPLPGETSLTLDAHRHDCLGKPNLSYRPSTCHAAVRLRRDISVLPTFVIGLRAPAL